MGMFDYVNVTCPHCKEIVEDQTKIFECCMCSINLDEELPSYVASSFEGRWRCQACHKEFYVVTGNPLLVKPKVVKDKPEHFKEEDVKFCQGEWD